MSRSPSSDNSGACPSPEELFDFSVGSVTQAAQEEIARHLDGPCVRCEKVLLELADRKDPLIADLQEAPPLSSADAEKACGWALAGLSTDVYVDPAASPGQPIKIVRVVGPGGIPGGDLQTLLRRRLQFASLLVAGFYVLLLFKSYTFYEGYTQLGQYTFLDWTIFLVDQAAFAGEVIVACLLWNKRILSLPNLRRIEWVVWGLPLLNQCVLEWQRLFVNHRLLTLQTWTESIVSGRYDVLPWFTLIIGYGVVIPNTWRRCSAVVSAVAGLALALNFLAAVADGVVFHSAVLLHIFEVVIWLTFAVAFAVYNSYRIEEIKKRGDEFGQYRLLGKLGEGGMGEVWEAEHKLLRRRGVIKLIRPEMANDPYYRRFFEQEAKKTAALTHPNTIVIYDYGQVEDGRLYYAMEYLKGVPLSMLVERHGSLPPGRAVFLLQQVCSALREAQDQGLVHRDIKPNNIMVCERGRLADMAKLLDFGLVRDMHICTAEEHTDHGAVVGTRGWMAPEQWRGVSDHRSDLYSLGATAYFLLTGKMPPGPETPWDDVPADLQEVVQRCLEHNPEKRFQSADDLERALAGCGCATEWDRASAAAWWRDHGKVV